MLLVLLAIFVLVFASVMIAKEEGTRTKGHPNYGKENSNAANAGAGCVVALGAIFVLFYFLSIIIL